MDHTTSSQAATPTTTPLTYTLAVTLARWLTAEQAIYPAADSALTTSHLGAALSVSPFLSVSASKPFVSLILPTPTPAVSPLESMFAPTPDGDIRTVRVPILMYHYLSTPPADANIYRRDLSVAPELFAQHLERIQLEGYTTTSLYDLLLHLTQGAALPPHPVILTFDDGYRDNYEYAFPLLVKHRMQATFFVVTDFIDEQRSEYLTWDMVREMYAAGMSIESHGRNHASLQDRDDDYLIWQALGSLETIQFELGVRPHFVSYPAGEYDQRTIDIFRSAHFWAGLTTKQGATHTSDDLFQLHRVRVRGSTTPDELARLLALDW